MRAKIKLNVEGNKPPYQGYKNPIDFMALSILLMVKKNQYKE